MALFDPTEGLEELISLNNLMLNSAKLVAVNQGKYIARLVGNLKPTYKRFVTSKLRNPPFMLVL